MKSRGLIVAAAIVSALAARPAGAQEAAPTLQEDPRAARFKDVERGFFMGFDFGWMGLFKTPTADPVGRSYAGAGGGAAGGILVGVNAGVDLGSLVALSAFVSGANERASVDYGAFSLYVAGLDVRVSPVSFKDRNGWDRLFLYAHARGGVARTEPKGLFGSSEQLLSGGVGCEYFTRLRHYSVGLAADLVYAKKAGSLGFAAYPTVRYTF